MLLRHQEPVSLKKLYSVTHAFFSYKCWIIFGVRTRFLNTPMWVNLTCFNVVWDITFNTNYGFHEKFLQNVLISVDRQTERNNMDKVFLIPFNFHFTSWPSFLDSRLARSVFLGNFPIVLLVFSHMTLRFSLLSLRLLPLSFSIVCLSLLCHFSCLVNVFFAVVVSQYDLIYRILLKDEG